MDVEEEKDVQLFSIAFVFYSDRLLFRLPCDISRV